MATYRYFSYCLIPTYVYYPFVYIYGRYVSHETDVRFKSMIILACQTIENKTQFRIALSNSSADVTIAPSLFIIQIQWVIWTMVTLCNLVSPIYATIFDLYRINILGVLYHSYPVPRHIEYCFVSL